MRNWKMKTGILGMLVVMAFLSSCGQMIPILSTDTELTLGRDQKWSMQYVAVLPGEVRMFAQQYQTTLDQMVGEARARGITASWELLPPKSNDTNISYKVNLSGSGFDLLNQEVFRNASEVMMDPSAKNQVKFAFDPRSSLFSQGQYNTFTLKSSKILSSNGNRVNDSSVRWVNPTTVMSATVSTTLDLTWLWISLLGLGGIGFIIAGFGVMRKPSPRKLVTAPALAVPALQPSPPKPTSIKYCPKCGQQNPAEAGFCPHCGSKFSSL